MHVKFIANQNILINFAIFIIHVIATKLVTEIKLMAIPCHINNI